MANTGEPSFFIKSDENAFINRQKNIFDQLNLVDKEKKNSVDYIEPDLPLTSAIRNEGKATAHYKKETKHFRGKESIFKRPVSLPPRFKSHNLPDFQRNPEKWVKYSLGDVSNEDMSERSNTAAAMSFLKELADRKNFNSGEEDNSFGNKITFKPQRKSELSCSSSEEGETTSENEKSAFRCSKVVMPEYVVGREKKKIMKRSSKSKEESKNSKEIKLSHLDEEDE